MALWVTARTARVSLAVRRDSREWTGQILALIVVVCWLAEIALHGLLTLVD